MFCPHCGKQIPDGSKFCTACGAVLTDEVRAAVQQPQQSDPQPYAQQPNAQQGYAQQPYGPAGLRRAALRPAAL